VDQLLQNQEYSIREEAKAKMTEPTTTTATPENPAQTSQPQTDNAILKKVMDSPNMSVAQVAQVANRGQLAAGQPVQLRS
jgi:hypothetical protein